MNSEVLRFMAASMPASASMRFPSSAERSAARPNCSVSRRPRRLSSTNVFMSPIASRKRRPPRPCARDAARGTATPITRYAAAASAASSGEAAHPMKMTMPTDTMVAMTIGEMVCA